MWRVDVCKWCVSAKGECDRWIVSMWWVNVSMCQCEGWVCECEGWMYQYERCVNVKGECVMWSVDVKDVNVKGGCVDMNASMWRVDCVNVKGEYESWIWRVDGSMRRVDVSVWTVDVSAFCMWRVDVSKSSGCINVKDDCLHVNISVWICQCQGWLPMWICQFEEWMFKCKGYMGQWQGWMCLRECEADFICKWLEGIYQLMVYAGRMGNRRVALEMGGSVVFTNGSSLRASWFGLRLLGKVLFNTQQVFGTCVCYIGLTLAKGMI